MTCEACEHEKVLNNVDYSSDDDYWLDIVDEIGHICDDYNCPHTCSLSEYN